MKPMITITAAAFLLASLNGCIGAGAATIIGTASGVASIAKDVFDIDVSVHSLLGRKQVEQMQPAEVVANPSLIVTGK